jgi:ArsR family transcriptional regulator, cadmium/lead-responsive transcriptional repressor
MIPVATRQDLSVKSKFFRGLADPARLAILEALIEGALPVGEIVATTGMSQSNTSNHLACLRDCGLVCRRPEGRMAYYEIADDRIPQLLRLAEGIVGDVAAEIYHCTRYTSND